jgi:2-polyprenyl-6-methoxyphenol hydroxylase-like FAD-dependent oxidoreductase
MKSWSKGRVGLVGDAAFCPSLLAGQGSALAMIAAYVFAGELGTNKTRPEQALQRYEQRLHAFMVGKQSAAKKLAGSFTPRTQWGLFVRNQVTKAFAIPFLLKWVMGNSLVDRLELPDYAQRAGDSVL